MQEFHRQGLLRFNSRGPSMRRRAPASMSPRQWHSTRGSSRATQNSRPLALAITRARAPRWKFLVWVGFPGGRTPAEARSAEATTVVGGWGTAKLANREDGATVGTHSARTCECHKRLAHTAGDGVGTDRCNPCVTRRTPARYRYRPPRSAASRLSCPSRQMPFSATARSWDPPSARTRPRPRGMESTAPTSS